jgi:diaminohydroxyphosphoribosylaminopyrimidine deaminase/5-amino-6-(5-phosphoribosylamino)uracil reductase
MLFEGLALGGRNEDFSDCILYVSLEPCAHFGKTPPCANLILEKGVGRVVVGVLDPNPKVSGRGVEILRTAGVEVIVGVLEDECRGLNRAFWVNQRLGRAAVVAKWAETGDGFMGSGTSDRVKISGAVAGDWVMELRRGMDAILVGVDTWDLDQPKLNVRGYGDVDQPVRIVLDRTGRGEYTVEGLGRSEGELWVIGGDLNLSELLKWLYEAHGLGVILVEGGAKVLESFFEADCVDEVHVLRNAAMVLGDGVKSPRIGNLELWREDDLGLDEHLVWERDLG